MKMRLFFCVFLIGPIMCSPTEQSDGEVADGVFKSASRAMDVYSKTLDEVIPWNVFHKIIETIQNHQGNYRGKSGQLVGEIKTALMNSEEHYFQTTQSIYNWCGESVPILEAYTDLMKDQNEEKANKQKDLLISMLDSGISKMDDALKSLNGSSMSLNIASGKLEELANQLIFDFKENDHIMEEEIRKVRNNQWIAWFNPIAGLITTIINEVSTIPQLRANLEQVRNIFDEIKDVVKKGEKEVSKARGELHEEMVILGDMRSSTTTTRKFVILGLVLRSAIQNSINKLTGQCEAYRSRHKK